MRHRRIGWLLAAAAVAGCGYSYLLRNYSLPPAGQSATVTFSARVGAGFLGGMQANRLPVHVFKLEPGTCGSRSATEYVGVIYPGTGIRPYGRLTVPVAGGRARFALAMYVPGPRPGTTKASCTSVFEFEPQPPGAYVVEYMGYLFSCGVAESIVDATGTRTVDPTIMPISSCELDPGSLEPFAGGALVAP